MDRRPRKKTDQDEAEKAFKLLKESMANHSEIEPSLWASAIWSVLVDGYVNCGFSYEEFQNEWDRVKHHYKPWFDKEENGMD